MQYYLLNRPSLYYILYSDRKLKNKVIGVFIRRVKGYYILCID